MSKMDTALCQANGRQIAQMAHDAAVWYKTSFLQCKLFLDSMEENDKAWGNDCFKLPWDMNDSIPPSASKLFWITAIFHTLDNINCLNRALLFQNDERINVYADRLLNENDFYDKVKNLRNPNEHKIDYMLGNGHNQSDFIQTIDTDMGKMATNAHWFVAVHGDCFIGGMDCKDIITHMKKYRDEIIPCLEEIATEYWR